MMKIIPKGTINGMLPIKKGKDSKLRAMLLQLEVGDTLEIDKSEWTRKKPPYHIVGHIKRKLNRTFLYNQKLDESGWMFQRLS
jgi:hypothetical protein